MKYKLTKKSQKELYNSHVGKGIAYIHTKENEIVAFDFWLGMNGKFIAGGTLTKELSEYLEDLKSEIEVEK
jgi:hypothetical protein